jgi:ABC-2 type transport system ATP-binding protein
VYGIDAETVDGLRSLDGVTAVSVEDREQAQVVIVQSAAGRELTHVVLRRLGDVNVGRISAREPTLEDAYVALVTEQ